jgi:hypothetical protein
MPSYKIEFGGGGQSAREPLMVFCANDAQAMNWASGLLGGHLGAEISEGTRQVGWVTASGDGTSKTQEPLEEGCPP